MTNVIDFYDEEAKMNILQIMEEVTDNIDNYLEISLDEALWVVCVYTNDIAGVVAGAMDEFTAQRYARDLRRSGYNTQVFEANDDGYQQIHEACEAFITGEV